METTERKVKVDGDVEISKEAFDKIGKDAIEEYKKEIGRSIMRKDYQCSTCKSFPRPENAMSKGKTLHTFETVTHCSICSNVFCLDCISHTCSDGGEKESDMSRSLESAAFSTFEWNLEFKPYLSYFCENAKFGCQENFFKEEELYKHEKYCSYQRVYCVDIECEENVCLLDYLEHFKSTHGNSENRSNDKTFHLPIELDILQEVCTFTKFTVFEKTFFDVSIIRENTIFKWIYSLCLPKEAEMLFYHAFLTDKNDVKVATVYEQVRSMVESPDSVIEDGNCFILGVQKAKRYAVDGGNKVDFSVQITSLKDEDEDEESGIDD